MIVAFTMFYIPVQFVDAQELALVLALLHLKRQAIVCVFLNIDYRMNK